MESPHWDKQDYVESVSHIFAVLALGAALVAALITPLLAVQWANRPFLGVLVEPTLIITDTYTPKWTGRSASVRYPERIVRLAGVAVDSPADYDAALLASADVVGQKTRVLTRLPDGSERSYPDIGLGRFPPGDLLRYFALPYAIGLAYLAIGAWTYRARCHTRPGRALAFFCFCAALDCFLLFDLFTTHLAPALWTFALALTGGTLLSLALRFPEESRPITRRPWLLFLPYGGAAALASEAVIALGDGADPWAYLDGWRKIYTFVGLVIIIFVGVMIYHASRSRSPLVRQQARIVLLGSLLSFGPVTAWFLAVALKLSVTWDVAMFMPELLVFPISLAVAIFRYRLLDTEVIVNRTLVYGTATAVLAGVFAISLGLWQKLFVALTGEKSDTAIIITSLLVASAFSPLKSRLQSIVDRRLRQLPDDTRQLQSFGEDLRAYTEMRQAEHVARRLLSEAVQGLRAESGAVSLFSGGRIQMVDSYGRWKGEAWICLPIECDGRRFGLLSLGPRQGRQPYGQRECHVLQQVTLQAARAMRLNIDTWPPGTTAPGPAGLEATGFAGLPTAASASANVPMQSVAEEGVREPA